MINNPNADLEKMRAYLGMSSNIQLNDMKQFRYEDLIRACPNVHPLIFIGQPISGSSYQFPEALKINENDTVIDMNGIRTFKNDADIRTVFYNIGYIIENSIVNSISEEYFKYKLTNVTIRDNQTYASIIFVRVKAGSTDEECCYNLNNNGIGVNYFISAASNDYAINPNDSKENYVSNLFGNKLVCDPRYKRLETGSDICRSELNDFCSEGDTFESPPRIVEQTSINTPKHPRCNIDFKKRYPADYDKILNSVCNDYDEGIDGENKKTYLFSSDVCVNYCRPITSKCPKGFKKYCTQKGKSGTQYVTRLFYPECRNFMVTQDDYDIYLEKYCVKDSTVDIYRESDCVYFRDLYNKCIVNKNNSKEEDCKAYYQSNPNITAIEFNKVCDENPNLPICNQKIIQKDIYQNKYDASPNEYFAAKKIKQNNPKEFANASEDFIIKSKKDITSKQITENIMYHCLDNNNQSGCKNVINNYMSREFIDKCVKGDKSALETEEICIKIKNNNKITGYNNILLNYCSDRNSTAYNLPKCVVMRGDLNNRNKIFYAIGIIGIFIVLFIVFFLIKKYI